MKVVGILLAGLIVVSACSEDAADSQACKNATKEAEDASEAVRILRANAPPNVCNPCTVQQTYQKELAKLQRIEAEKKAAKARACS